MADTPETTPLAGGALPAPADAVPEKAPPRPIEDVVRDLERERSGLVDAVDQLKSSVKATKQRLFNPKILAVAGGVVVGLFVLRRVLKSRHKD